MELKELWPWIALAGLGAYHGVNPAMGWLFAVALGLQERSRSAVYRAFLPIVLGHAAAVALVVALVTVGIAILPLRVLKLAGAAMLLAFGLYMLLGRQSHPRWVGMQVGFRDLMAWSFLMASAHGAGLMLVPVLFNLPIYEPSLVESVDAHHIPHVEFMSFGAPPTIASQLTAVSIHTLAMFGVMALVAVAVFELVGIAVLRRAWFNFDRIWAIALIMTGLLTLLL